jgi:hypothetical protein
VASPAFGSQLRHRVLRRPSREDPRRRPSAQQGGVPGHRHGRGQGQTRVGHVDLEDRRADNAEAAAHELEAFGQGIWSRKHPAIAQSWRRDWRPFAAQLLCILRGRQPAQRLLRSFLVVLGPALLPAFYTHVFTTRPFMFATAFSYIFTSAFSYRLLRKQIHTERSPTHASNEPRTKPHDHRQATDD